MFDKAWRCNKHLLNTRDNESIYSTKTFATDSVSTISSGGVFISTMKEKFSLRKQPDCIIRKVSVNKCKIWWKNNRSNFAESVQEFIFHTLLSDPDNSVYKIYTEIKINGLRYRASPNYRGVQWYDWAIVRFELSNEDHNRNEYNRCNVK